MPTRCPYCQAPLTLDESRGADCPACGKSLRDGPPAGSEPPPLPRGQDEYVREGRSAAPRRDDYDDRVSEGRPASRARDYDDDDDEDYGGRSIARESYGTRLDPAWGTVQAGITTMFVSYVVIIVALVMFIFMIVAGILFVAGGNQMGNPNAGLIMGICLFGLAIAGGGIAYLVGMFMCLAAPRAKGWMGAALGLFAVSILWLIGGSIIVSGGMQRGQVARDPGLLIVTSLGFNALASVGFVCVLVFLRQVGAYFRRSGVGIMSNICMILVLLGFALQAATLFAGGGPGANAFNQNNPFQFAADDNALTRVFTILQGLNGLILIVLFLVLLMFTRNAIARAAQESYR